MQYINIEEIHGAKYNPRKINEEQFEALKHSIKTLGFILPIIINEEDMTIVAGHQRTKAAQTLGIKKVPALFIKKTSMEDEIKFNQLHNGCTEKACVGGTLFGEYKQGFHSIEHDQFNITNANANLTNESGKLILRYGNCLCCIVCNNKVIFGAEYVKACVLMGVKVNTSIIPKEHEKELGLLFKNFGEYSYEHLNKNTWVQGMAQMNRNADENAKVKKRNKSTLYERFVLPELKANESLLDFGCGKGAYINSIVRDNAIGVEFYNNNGKEINVTLGNMQIDRLCNHLKEKGKFDKVVCDSVINSTDSLKADMSVIGCCNVFLKMGGVLYISGRPIEEMEKIKARTKVTSQNRYIRFLDDNGFDATFRNGNWYYQHFHSKDSIHKELEQQGFEIIEYTCMKFGSNFQVKAIKKHELEVKEQVSCINFEFNLPLPRGKSYNRHNDVLKALKLC